MTRLPGAQTRLWPESAQTASFAGPFPTDVIDLGAEFVVEWQVVEDAGLEARREGAPRH